MAALDIAARAIGLNEGDKKAALQEYLSNGGVNLDPAVTAWCAAFVNATLQQAGVQGTGSNMARSFLDWGQPVQTPQRGDVAVFSRGDPNGPYGHVGLVERINPDGTIQLLSGNSGDQVQSVAYSTDRLLGYRRAPGEANALSPVAGGGQMPSQGGNALAFVPQRSRLDPRDFMRENTLMPPVDYSQWRV